MPLTQINLNVQFEQRSCLLKVSIVILNFCEIKSAHFNTVEVELSFHVIG